MRIKRIGKNQEVTFLSQFMNSAVGKNKKKTANRNAAKAKTMPGLRKPIINSRLSPLPELSIIKKYRATNTKDVNNVIIWIIFSFKKLFILFV